MKIIYWFATLTSFRVPFVGNTRGLLGTFDGDATNNFTTRDEVLLPVLSLTGSNGEQEAFGNSCALSSGG